MNMLSAKIIASPLPKITAEDIKSVLDCYKKQKGMFSLNSEYINELQNLYNKLEDKKNDIPNHAMLDLVYIVATKEAIDPKTALAIMFLKDKFLPQFLYAMSFYKDYKKFATIEQLQEIHKNPQQAKALVDKFNMSNYIEQNRKDLAASIAAGGSFDNVALADKPSSGLASHSLFTSKQKQTYCYSEPHQEKDILLPGSRSGD